MIKDTVILQIIYISYILKMRSENQKVIIMLFLTIWRSHNLWENQMLILSFDPLVWLRLMRSGFTNL